MEGEEIPHIHSKSLVCRGRDRVEVGFPTTCAISAHHH